MRRQYLDNLDDCRPATVEPAVQLAGHAAGQVSAFVVAVDIAAAAVPNQDYCSHLAAAVVAAADKRDSVERRRAISSAG